MVALYFNSTHWLFMLLFSSGAVSIRVAMYHATYIDDLYRVTICARAYINVLCAEYVDDVSLHTVWLPVHAYVGDSNFS